MRTAATAVFVAILTMSSSAQARNSNPHVLPPQSGAHGGYSQLAARWWQWAVETPGSVSPLTDTTGEFAGVNQSGSVWFLAGNFGGSTERTVTVPAGKALFFPILNSFFAAGPDDPHDIDVLRAIVREAQDTATDMACEIDGKSVQNLTSYREESAVFRIDLPADNVYGDPSFAGVYEPCVDDGIYVLVAPLRPGQHTIHFRGSLPAYDFTLDVTYHLTVAPTN